MVLLKLLLGGVLACVIAWCIVVGFHYVRTIGIAKAQGTSGLIAVAGGWDYLAQLPAVLMVLTAAFGLGIYFTSRLVLH